jgi:hypothetical protein
MYALQGPAGLEGDNKASRLVIRTILRKSMRARLKKPECSHEASHTPSLHL